MRKLFVELSETNIFWMLFGLCFFYGLWTDVYLGNFFLAWVPMLVMSFTFFIESRMTITKMWCLGTFLGYGALYLWNVMALLTRLML